MSGPGTRKALAELVGNACDSDLHIRHSENIVSVLGKCEHGHGMIGNYDESPRVEDWTPLKACTNCFRWLQAQVELGTGLSICSHCEHACAMEVTAGWPDGRSITLRYTPQATTRERKAS